MPPVTRRLSTPQSEHRARVLPRRFQPEMRPLAWPLRRETHASRLMYLRWLVVCSTYPSRLLNNAKHSNSSAREVREDSGLGHKIRHSAARGTKLLSSRTLNRLS